jgi:3-hydroxybutyryl-CoA dehydrogenase
MEIARVLVVGAGTMGCQIAMQSASHGLDVTVVDQSPEAIDSACSRLRRLAAARTKAGYAAADPEAIRVTTDLGAGRDADLVSESVTEDPMVKGQVFAALNEICPPTTLFTTNTSSLLPSMYAAATGRPDRFCALHFHLPVWSANLVDVMPHAGTAEATMDDVVAFARRIDQVPIRLAVESPGYVFNAMYSALNREAITLAANGIAAIPDIDLAWTTITKMPAGPFGMLDHVGIDTAWHITDYWAGVTGDRQLLTNAAWLKAYVDRGHLGVKTGRGFYDYSAD